MPKVCEHDPRIVQLSERCFVTSSSLLNEIGAWSPEAVELHFKFGTDWKQMKDEKKIAIPESVVVELAAAFEDATAKLQRMVDLARDRQYRDGLKKTVTWCRNMIKVLNEARQTA